MTALSANFTLSEMTESDTADRLGLDNTPGDVEINALRRLCEAVLQPLRDALGRPVRVSSGYRAPAVNAAIPGGSPTSQHIRGEAADISVDGLTAEELAARILSLGLPFDQMIWYAPERGGHLHISYTERRPRRAEVYHAPAGGGIVRRYPSCPECHRPWGV